ncbi:MAG TPA: hypothetical protein VH309_09160, partial [Elusimicrobiota bacterium]|nr:hypothetical protein [Elusimicrobiota bacterium]
DLAVRNRLVDKLSKELSEKELSLAKSLGVIRRLEEDLNRLCPEAGPRGLPASAAAPVSLAPRPQAPPAPAYAPASPEPPALTGPAIPPAPEPLIPLEAAPAPKPVPLPLTPYTLDEPPSPPPYLEEMPPSERPKAQQALVSFLRRIFPGQDH